MQVIGAQSFDMTIHTQEDERLNYRYRLIKAPFAVVRDGSRQSQ